MPGVLRAQVSVNYSEPPASPRAFAARIFRAAAGRTLPYRLLKPKKYDAGKRWPLVLFLHGAGERGEDNRAQLRHGVALFSRPEIREKFPCFVVVPQCPRGRDEAGRPWGWTGAHPLLDENFSLPQAQSDAGRLALEIVAALQSEFSIDADRLYLAGISMGGFGVWDILARFPDKFAAAMPVCGGGDPQSARRFARVPVWAFHGALDDVVPAGYTRGMIAAMRAFGGSPRYTEYPDVAHDSWSPAFAEPELLPWLFAQRR